MRTYLNSKDYYEELYDLHTIKECLDYKERILATDISKHKCSKSFNINQHQQVKENISEFALYFIKGERYRNKEKTIREWIEKDKEKDEKLNNASVQKTVYCGSCGEEMEEYNRMLKGHLNKPTIVMFFMKCSQCNQRKMIYEDGTEKVYKTPRCPNCSTELIETHTYSNDKAIWKKECPSCSYYDESIDDFKQWEQDREAERKKEKILLGKYRSVFCLSANDGIEYITQMDRFKQLEHLTNQEREKKENPKQQKLNKINKLEVSELETLLTKQLQKEKFTQLTLSPPEIGKYVIIPFSLKNKDLNRQSRDCIYTAQRMIKKLLENTNWRLMSDGLQYRLGYLSGRLKGYENIEELLV